MAVGMYKVITSLRSSNALMRRHVSKQNVVLMPKKTVMHSMVKPESLLKRKFAEIVYWYEELTGMDEVRIAQNRVLEAEEKFVTAQERRRDANKLLSVIQNKLKDLYAELDNTSRGEERYVFLITQEHSVLKEEKQAVEEFHRYEREERDYFAALSSSVKESHEKERAQAERTKYWSIIGSIIGTVIGVVGSSVNSQLKMKELRQLIKESLTKPGDQDISVNVPAAVSKHEKELLMIVSEMKTIASMPEDNVLGQLNKLIHTLDNKVNGVKAMSILEEIGKVLISLKEQEAVFDKNFQELKSIVLAQNIEIGDDQVIVLPFGMEERMQQQQQETRLIVTCCTLATIIIPILCKYFGLV